MPKVNMRTAFDVRIQLVDSKRRKALAEHILAGLADPRRLEKEETVKVEFWQSRPYTACKITYRSGPRVVVTLGFTKVCYPDKWEAEYGRRLAAKKAAHEAARQAMAAWEEWRLPTPYLKV